jgi:Glycoside Hydrolase Family 113
LSSRYRAHPIAAAWRLALAAAAVLALPAGRGAAGADGAPTATPGGASTVASSAPAAADPFAEVRGVTVSCLRAGEEWGSDDMVRTLATLADLGVNWVAIHPYGGLRNDGTVGRSGIDRLYDHPYWLVRAIREAHRHGMKILIKPHLAYWGSRFSWRGEIAFDDAADWRRFFETYREWIVRVARLSREADAFAVGTELDRTVGHEKEWRRIIADVRHEIDVPLTYSASWDSYESVPFWDALDAIAVQAYFPLVSHQGMPTDGELAAAWTRIAGRLSEFGKRHGRHVVLGELGYNRSLDAAIRPWDYRTSADPAAEALQARCLDAALTAVSRTDGIAGAFLWKWFPGEFPRGNFLVSTPAMRAVVARHWAGRGTR